ncbi:MAG TPA: hypothetical protein VFA20_10220 [Myxococcaceae bacterium]|nr:hypothetical protein [Myxococcaceae bacterium]
MESDSERLEMTPGRQVAPGVRVVRDPTESDPHHCLLSGATPNQFVSRATWRN